jgi:hypothetical protein
MVKQRRTEYIGARFTKKERQTIEEFAKDHNLTLTNLVRQALFSHIKFLNQFDECEANEGKSYLLIEY